MLKMLKTSFVSRFLSRQLLNRRYCSAKKKYVLGIETSCDDTGAAILDDEGKILGEGYESQMKIHLENGGIIPHIAVHFHEEHIKNVVSSALEQSKLSIKDLSAIAVTTRPGLKGSLQVGIDHAKQIARLHNIPLIPVHHMEAHALTARLIQNVEFPFLCLLASGGHCQLVLVRGLDQFFLLGTSQHNSPGEVLDKIARRLKLSNLPQCSSMSGGAAMDFMSKDGDPTVFQAPVVMTHYRNCHFSFSGFGSFAMTTIEEEERKHDVPADGVIPNAHHFCASILHGFARHLVHRIHRGFLFCESAGYLRQRTLVFSGGVACSEYIKGVLREACRNELGAEFVVPPPKLCVDNGVMIAWNGMERLKANIGVVSPTEELQPHPNCSLGVDISEEVQKANIKCGVPKMTPKKENQQLQLELN